MNRYFKFFILIIVSVLLHSCKEIIDVDTPSAVTKLVIEADLTLKKGADNTHQTIKLKETGDLNIKKDIPAKGAEVSVSFEDNTILFPETEPGIYTTDNFIAKMGKEYTLNIKYNNEDYQSKQEFVAVPKIKAIGQSIENGATSDEPEVIWSWDDPAGIDNYYFLEIKYKIDTIEEIQYHAWSWDDSFQDGNELGDYFETDEFKKGMDIKVSLSGVTGQYLTFLQLLENQENGAPGPFTVTPVNIKGNILNISTYEHYPYGYFVMREVDEVDYIFE